MASAGVWVSDGQPGASYDALCQALLKRLRTVPNECSPYALATFPEFQSPPWERLDPSEHRDLIAKLLGYRGGPVILRAPEVSKAAVDRFIRDGGELYQWRTRLLSAFGDVSNRAPPGAQTVVELIERHGPLPPPPKCPGKIERGHVSTYIVNDDLSGPDIRLSLGIAGTLELKRPVVYHGQTLLIGAQVVGGSDGTLAEGSVADVFKDFPETGLQGRVCSMRYLDTKSTSRKKK
ncbi:MAG TPA: hypothetical protein VGN07_22500 [Steroidobacteraceae bacterium]